MKHQQTEAELLKHCQLGPQHKFRCHGLDTFFPTIKRCDFSLLAVEFDRAPSLRTINFWLADFVQNVVQHPLAALF